MAAPYLIREWQDEATDEMQMLSPQTSSCHGPQAWRELAAEVQNVFLYQVKPAATGVKKYRML